VVVASRDVIHRVDYDLPARGRRWIVMGVEGDGDHHEISEGRSVLSLAEDTGIA
jgi:hypothetical protein